MPNPGSPTVMVRCDVGPTQGVGHLMRCLALAEELTGRGHRVVICGEVSSLPFALAQVTARGLEHVAAPSPWDSPEAHVDLVHVLGADAVVLDSYRLPTGVYDALRVIVPTLALVDGDPAGRPADLHLDQNIGAEHDDWGAGGPRLAGLSHALMRDDVLRHRPDDPDRRERDPLGVLAFFGGTDAFGAAPVVAAALAASCVPVDLTVVAGRPDLRAALEALTLPGTVTVLDPVEDIARRVRGADVVLSAAGTSSWELFCLGAVCGFVCVAENQQAAYDRVVDQGYAVGLGLLEDLRADPASAAPALTGLLTDAAHRARLRRTAWELVDGKGRVRVADALEDLMRAPARR